MKVTNYIIIQDRDLRPLEAKVHDQILYGWVPHGSLVAVTQSPGNTLFCQPMIKYEDSPTFDHLFSFIGTREKTTVDGEQ